MDVGDFSDEDGIYALEWSMKGAYDPIWDTVTTVTVINSIASL